MNKKNKETKTYRHRQLYGGYQKKEDVRVLKDSGGQTYVEIRRIDFGWWTCNTIY